MVSLRKKIIFVIITSTLVYFYMSSKPRRKVSDLLQEVLDYTELLNSTEHQLVNFLVESTFDKLVNEEVKPAVDKIASVRKQTEIMEGMDRMQGGPQNFMTTSIAILDKIQKDLHTWESQYRLATARMQRYWPALLKLVEQCENKIKFFDSPEFFEPLAELQIYFEGMDFDDVDKKRRQQLAKKSPKTLGQLMELVKTKLIPMMKNFEKIKIEKNEPPFFKIEDVKNLKFFSFFQEMVSHLKKYDAHYEYVGRYWVNVIKHLRSIRDDAVDRVLYSKTRYEELGTGLDNDITNLRERIQNLKNPRKPPTLEL